MIELIVTSPFLTYSVGDSITDPALVSSILDGPFSRDVVKIDVPGAGGPESLTLQVLSAVAGTALALGGVVTNATPSALDFSTDGGTSWVAVGGFALSGGGWTGSGPVYMAAQTGSIIVRDHGAPSVQSATVMFSVTAPAQQQASNSGTVTLADGSAIDAIGAGLTAPKNMAGLLSVVFGTQAGTVADGGALAAEAATRAAADSANAQAAAVAQTEAGSAQAAANAAQATATAAQSTANAAQSAAAAAQTASASAETAAGSAQSIATAAQAAISGAQAAAAAAQSTATAAQTGANTAASMASAAQAAAAAALQTTAIGAAGGVAPLDSAAHVPMANLPAIAGQAWSDPAGSSAIFHRGPVPAPLNPRAGLLLGDKLKILGEFNFAEVWDTQATYDAWPELQNFLLYCQLMALAMKNDSIDNITQRNCVRAILPRGAYLISQPLIVPEYVDLDCRGTLYRAAYTTDQSGTGTSVAGPFASNQFLPTVIITPRAHSSNLNIYVNTDGQLAHRGSGVCIGKTWAAQIGAACTIGNAGTGYAVGDLLFMAQPSAGPYFNWAAQVTAISGGGATGPIAAATVYAAGAYALPPTTYNGGPSLQQQQWSVANGFSNILDTANPGCFLVHSAYQSNGTTPSAGTGATLAPVWQTDYMPGVAEYNIGSAITNGSQIGKIQVTGGIPGLIDSVHGPSFGVMVTGLETVIGEIQVLGGNVGVYGYFAQDVRIGILNAVESGTGVELFGCGSWHCPLIVLDTCGAAFLINETQGVRFLFRAFFEQGNIGLPNVYPNSLGNAIQIGTASSPTYPNSDIRLEGELVNMGGLPQSTIAANPGTAVGGQTARPMTASIFLAYLFSSVIRVKVSNIGEQGGLTSILPTSGFCSFGFNVDPGNVIEGVLDSIPTIDGVSPPPAIMTATTGHGFPACAIRVWDGLHQCWVGPFNVVEMFGTAAPVNGTTGAGLAMPGSTYVDTTGGSGRRYVNTGTQGAPVWS